VGKKDTSTKSSEVTTTTTEKTDNVETTQSVDTTLVTSPSSSGTMSHLVKILPHMKDDLATMRKVTKEEFTEAMAALPEEFRNNFQKLLEQMNPKKTGMHAGPTKFTPFVLIANQGIGSDPMRPQRCPKGAAYSSTGDLVMVLKEDMEAYEGKPSKIAVSVVGMYNSRIFFAQKDASGNPKPPPGVELKGTEPVCYSRDRIRGVRYGECDSCPYRPQFGAATKACQDGLDLYVMNADMSVIYVLGLKPSSFKGCSGVIEKRQKTWPELFSGQFWLSNELIKRPGQEFVVWKADPRVDKSNNPVMNSPEVIRLLNLVARQIETDVYLPSLAGVYLRQSEGSGTEETTVSPEIIAAAAGGIDYSGSGNV